MVLSRNGPLLAVIDLLSDYNPLGIDLLGDVTVRGGGIYLDYRIIGRFKK